MISEKERNVSKENYEISLKISKLFKKYQNYEEITNKKMNVEYNPNNLFKNNKKVNNDPSEDNNVDE
ncbi:MAG: hypothetical protein Q4E75_02360 [bacterium]|nr:hypothetical protein [bacterium]